MVMAAVAYVGVFHLPSAYYLFFFGVVELSSVPLAVVDLFHPHKGLPQLLEASAPLRLLNEAARAGRAGLVPAGAAGPLGVIVVSAAGLTLLQLHWAGLIAGQLLKMLRGGAEQQQQEQQQQKKMKKAK